MAKLFSAGDEVTMKELSVKEMVKLDSKNSHVGWCSQMERYLGKKVVIRKVRLKTWNNTNANNRDEACPKSSMYRIYGDGYDLWYCGAWFEEFDDTLEDNYEIF